MALIALLVRASLGRNVIFRQERIGINGGSFDVFKFRTMLLDRRKANVPISFPTADVLTSPALIPGTRPSAVSYAGGA